MADLILVGVITAAHGIRGEVKLRSFTADPEALPSYNPLQTAGGKALEVSRMRAQKDGFIASLKGVNDRNAAEALRGTELFVPRKRLPAPDDDELYVADLIGLTVKLKGGSVLGEVVGFPNYGASDLLDVKVQGRKDSVLIPYADPFVLETDLEARTITVDLPEDYLSDGKGERDA